MSERTGPTTEILEFQVDRIEVVLAAHRLPAHVHAGVASPRWTALLDGQPEMDLAARAGEIRI